MNEEVERMAALIPRDIVAYDGNGDIDLSYTLPQHLYNEGYRKLLGNVVVLPRKKYILAKELIEQGYRMIPDSMVVLIKKKKRKKAKKSENKCKYFKEIDYGYRQSKQCYAQKCAPEVNCNGHKSNCEKYPKVEVEE